MTPRRLLTMLAVAAVVYYLVLPQLAGARAAWHTLTDVRAEFLLLGAALEAAAVLSRARMLAVLIPPDRRPPISRLILIQLSIKAVTNLVPGGAAAGARLGYDQLRQAGVPGTQAGFALVAQGVGATVVLNALLWVVLVVLIPLRGFHPLYGTAALVGVALIGGVAVAVVFLTRGEDRAAAMVCRLGASLRLFDRDVLARALRDLADHLRRLGGRPKLMGRAAAWAAAAWLLSAGALWVFVAAFGVHVPVEGLLVAFGIANVLASVPVTPGGLGIMEGALTPLLVAFGTARAEAILGVVSWRLVNFWLPIPAGALAYVSLRLWPLRPDAAGEALRELADRSLRDAEPLDRWAARRGVTFDRRRGAGR